MIALKSEENFILKKIDDSIGNYENTFVNFFFPK